MPKQTAPSTVTNIKITHHPEALPKLYQLKERGLGWGLVARFFDALASGGVIADVEVTRDGGNAVAASGTVTVSGASGSVSVTINGVTISVTASSGDTAAAAGLAANIQVSGSALVSQFVTATSAGGVVTITAKNKGVVGNSITLAAAGTGMTASGARLTGGAEATTSGKATIST